MSKAHSIAWNRDGVLALSALKHEPPWMRDIRLEAWSRVKPADLPLEGQWPFHEAPRTSVPSRHWPADLQHALDERGDEEGLIVQRDSTVLSRAISKEQSKRGVIFTDLDTALQTASDLLRKHFAQQLDRQEPWIALHTAFRTGGTFLYVPQNTDVILPFHTCYWQSVAEAVMLPHTVMVVGSQSHVTLIDQFLSPTWPKPSLALAVAEASVGERSRVHYIALQNWGGGVRHRAGQTARIAVSGKLYTYTLPLGGADAEEMIQTTLVEKEGSQIRHQAVIRDSVGVEAALQDLPAESLKEKLRHVIVGRLTGQRPALTLEKVAHYHPEIRM